VSRSGGIAVVQPGFGDGCETPPIRRSPTQTIVQSSGLDFEVIEEIRNGFTECQVSLRVSLGELSSLEMYLSSDITAKIRNGSGG
jgi:hypothetical protein